MRDNLTRKANKMSKDINFNAIMEALNDKADRDGNNVTANHLKNINILGGANVKRLLTNLEIRL